MGGRKCFWGQLGNSARSPPIEGQVKRRATKIRSKTVGGGIVGRFSNFDKYPSEVAGDVISGLARDNVGTDVRATCGGSAVNSSRNI